MIQRLQTLFLALAVILTAISFFTPIYRQAIIDPQLWIGYSFAISLTLSMLLSLISIFLFKNRPIQMKVVKIAMLFQIVGFGVAVGVLFSLGGFGRFLLEEALGCFVIFLALAMQFLATKYINKDEELIRSMNRIR